MAKVSHFEEDKTIKVSGISEFAKDVLTKHFQSESIFVPACDVNKVALKTEITYSSSLQRIKVNIFDTDIYMNKVFCSRM